MSAANGEPPSGERWLRSASGSQPRWQRTWTSLWIGTPSRLGDAGARLVVLTQWGAESTARDAIAAMDLPHRCDVLGWSDILGLVRAAHAASDRATRRWLDELRRYLGEVTDMRGTDSNSVYVVSLGHQRPDGWE